MYQSQTWRLNPGETFTFGRASTSSAVLPAEDLGLSRNAGSFRYQHDASWRRTDSPPRLSDDDRLVLAARFEEYLTWRHAGDPAPRSAAETAERIGWQAHTVIKRCENIRHRYIRSGAPGLRGPRALEELVRLLMSTGALTADDLRRLPQQARPD